MAWESKHSGQALHCRHLIVAKARYSTFFLVMRQVVKLKCLFSCIGIQCLEFALHICPELSQSIVIIWYCKIKLSKKHFREKDISEIRYWWCEKHYTPTNS